MLNGQGNRGFATDHVVYSTHEVIDSIYATRVNRHTKPDIAFDRYISNPPRAYELVLMENTSNGNFPSCNPPNATSGISVCSPSQSATQTSRITFRIGAAGLVPLRKLEVWIDGTKRKETFTSFTYYSFMDSTLELTPGNHTVTLFAVGSDNTLIKRQFKITAR